MMGAAMSTAVSASASGSGGELATARLAEMLMVFKHDVRRLKADRERLQRQTTACNGSEKSCDAPWLPRID